MTTEAPAVDFNAIDMNSGWRRPAGYPDGIEFKILSGELDTAAKRGRRTTLARWRSGVEFGEVLTHDHVEEVFVIAGTLLWLDEAGAVIGRAGPNSYVCRPAGVPHGPFRAEGEFLAIEICYYEEKS
jgi:mannose-6-phosphate isomerase-like protein (cupin superfamily)